MKIRFGYKATCLADGIVGLIYGMKNLFFPSSVIETYGLDSSRYEDKVYLVTIRHFAMWIIFLAMTINFLAFAKDIRTKRLVMIAATLNMFLGTVFGILVNPVVGIWEGYPRMSWSFTLIYFFFFCAFGRVLYYINREIKSVKK